MILTAEADSLSTDARQLLEDYGLEGCHSSTSNDLSVHARTDSTGYFRLLWESSEEEEEDKNSHAAIFEVKLGKKQKKQSLSRASEQLIRFFYHLESVAYTTEDHFVPTAKCIHQRKTTGNQIRTSKTTVLCMSPPCGCYFVLSVSTVRDENTVDTRQEPTKL